MQLIELEVENWRGLTAKIGPFSETLNLICGPNESGKSRFFQALRFALFESHKGTAQHKKDLQSWTSVESPRVRLVFDVSDVRYTLTKQYLKGASAELSGNGQTLTDSDAEERLLELIGARESGSRGASEDAMGIWPLLMIAQGDSRKSASDALTNDSHSKLQNLLSDEIGAAAISASGKKLLELAAIEYENYFTATGQEKATLKQARQRAENAAQNLSAARDSYTLQVRTAAELADARQQLNDLAPRVESAQQAAKFAKQKADAARSAESDRDNKLAARDLAASRKENAEKALSGRRSLEVEIKDAERTLQSRRAKLAELVERESLLTQELAQKENAEKQTVERRDQARVQLRLAQRSELSRKLTDQITALQDKIKAAEENQAQIDTLRKKRGSMVEVSEYSLAELRELEQAFKLAEAKLHGAAMRIDISALQALSVNGEALEAGSQRELLITGRDRIRLDGIADIDVRPQEGTLDEQRATVDSAKRKFQEELEKLGFANVSDVARAEHAWSEISQRIKALQREGKLIANQPLPELQENLVKLTRQQSELGDVAGAIDFGAAEEALEKAQQALEVCQSQRASTEKLLNQQKEARAAESSSCEQLEDRQAERQSKLQLMADLSVLESELSKASETLVAAQLALDAANERYEALGGAQVTDDEARLVRAATNLQQRQSEARSKLDELQGSLRMLVGSGSYEQVQDCESELELANSDLTRLERDAAAAKRLFQVLAEKQQQLVDRLTAPVIARIQPYLAEIFPGSALRHGDKLDFTGLQSNNVEEDYAALSGGAQEQFSLMTRIGLAEVLAAEGRLPLVLDDSLVNSDADRIRQVHRALDRASERLQVIIFTCHEPLFDELGADYQKRLSPTRTGV